MIPLSLAVFGLIALLYLREQAHDRKETEWAKERNLLLTRIQTPHLAPQLAVVDDDNIVEFPTLGADGDFYDPDNRRVDD